MMLKALTSCLHVLVIASVANSNRLYQKVPGSKANLTSRLNVNYIEIDHELVPRKIENINVMSPLPVPPGRDYAMKKYPATKRQVQEIILEIEENKDINSINDYNDYDFNHHYKQPSGVRETDSWKNESEIRKSKLKSVIGTQGEAYYDADWGLMSAILTCYNNHWALRTGPEDWWTVVIRRIVQAMDENGDLPEVRSFFVEHEGKKKLEVNVGPSLSNIDFNWLFSQFSNQIRENIKVPGYVDIIENNFSTSTAEQKVISNIMLMSSLKKYFEVGIFTSCGIPGIEMRGTEQDWVSLVDKLHRLEILLAPISEHLGLIEWFNVTETVFNNLVDTYRGTPNIDWWTQILTWNQRPCGHSYFTGWFTEFFGVPWKKPRESNEFPSDLVSVPIHIEDHYNFPPVEDDGILVAGIVGFNVEEGDRAPVVEPTHAWSLLLPEQSPVAERLTGGYVGSETRRH